MFVLGSLESAQLTSY